VQFVTDSFELAMMVNQETCARDRI
jgi:hypothetical protein